MRCMYLHVMSFDIVFNLYNLMCMNFSNKIIFLQME